MDLQLVFISQGLISRTEDFDEAYRLILSKLVAFRERLQAADVLQPDILAKKRQLDQLVVGPFRLRSKRTFKTILQL